MRSLANTASHTSSGIDARVREAMMALFPRRPSRFSTCSRKHFSTLPTPARKRYVR